MDKKILNGLWSVFAADPLIDPPGSISLERLDCSESIPIDVPSDVNYALQRAGRIPNPHYHTNARDCYWVSSKEWWYTHRFVFDGSGPADLCLENVDGPADLWLNGLYLGRMENAFRLHRLPLGAALLQGENELFVRFLSIDQLLGKRLDELEGWKERRAYLRKPQFNFGWDWALPLPSIGLAGPVWIEAGHEMALMDVSVRPFIKGRVDFSFEVGRVAKEAGYEIRVLLSGYGPDRSKTISRNSYRSYTHIDIKDPQLWFPAGYGAQPLYGYRVQLVVDGEVKDERCGRIGLREVEILEEPFTEDAGPGYSFWLLVNGMRVFCKGGNWIPLELWPGTVKHDDYRFYLKKTVECNFNMQRIWGGGIYEYDRFYDCCDELGIMVWQDFMFASSGYPVDRLRDEIIAEADYQIRRLRNRTSIVLWCGCNEDVFSWQYHDDKAAARMIPSGTAAGSAAGSADAGEVSQSDTGGYAAADSGWKAVDRLRYDPQLYTMILRGLVGRYGLGIPYIESSPQSREDAGNMPNSGNCHISAWKYALFETEGRYADWRKHFEKVCSFDSEFCIQGPCSVKLLKSFLAPESHWPPNEDWIYHIQRGHAKLPHHQQTLMVAGASFAPIDSLQTYVKYGQATHLEMMRSEFESARRDYPNNGGTMMWMFNDCWPTSNWSIIDYTKNPKPCYYAAKRACAPVLPIIFERSGVVEFLVSNHSMRTPGVAAVWGGQRFDGQVLWSENSTARVKAGENAWFSRIKKTELNPDADYLFLDLSVDGEQKTRVIYFVQPWNSIKLPEPQYRTRIDRLDDRTLSIEVAALSFVRLFHILYTDDSNRPTLEDNYFDLSAGASRCIRVYFERCPDPASIRFGHWFTQWE